MTGTAPLWTLAYRNLLRNQRRTLATGLAMVFGYVALVLLSAYIFRTYMGLRTATIYLNQKGHVAILKKEALVGFAAKPKKFIIDQEDLKQIQAALSEHADLIEFTGSFLNGTGLLTQGTHAAPVMISGLEADKYSSLIGHREMKKWAPDWVKEFSGPTIDSMKSDPHLVSITAPLAEAIDRPTPLAQWKDRDRDVQLVAKSYNGDLGVVDAEIGIEHTTGMKLAEETSLIVPLPMLQDLLATDGIEYLAVFLKDASDTTLVSHSLRKKLGDRFDIFTYDDAVWSPVFVGSMNFLYVIAGFFVFLILGAVALTLVNTTTLNLLERTREIGTLRAIGYPPNRLKSLFRYEAVILCSVCIAIGTVIASLFAVFFNGLNIRFSPPGTQGDVQFLLLLSPWLCVIMGTLVFGITWLSTEFVVFKKAKQKIVLLLAETGA